MSESSTPPRRLNWKAILSGFAFDNIGAILVLGFILVAHSAVRSFQGVPIAEIPNRLYQSTALLVGMLVVSSLFNIGGAYIAAHLMPGDEIRHALLVGVCGLLLQVVFLLLVPNSDAPDFAPSWYENTSFALILPNAYLGGYLRRRRPRRAPSISTSRPPIPEP